jgi:tripartite-type tricarboxylate transporter receptor subunit TctC
MKKHFFTLILSLLPVLALAQWQPTKPITVVYGIGPGSGNERAFSIPASLIEREGRAKFINQHIPGVETVLGSNEFVKMPNDGHHIQVISIDATFIISELYNKQAMRYSLDDYTPVISIGKAPFVLIAHPGVLVNNMKEFVEYFRKDSRQIKIGIGTSGKIPTEHLFNLIGVRDHQAISVPYKSGNQAALDVAGGHLPFALLSAPIAYGLYLDGKVKFVAQTGSNRIEKIKTVSLAREALPGYVHENHWGVMLPRGTDKAVVDWYTTELNRAMATDDNRQRREDALMDLDTRFTNPTAWRREIEQQRALWLK